MRQAIETKYLGPTNYRGSRVKAEAEAGSITIGWDDALDVEENHRAGMMAFARKMGWLSLEDGGSWSQRGRWYGGGTKRGYVYVWVSEE